MESDGVRLLPFVGTKTIRFLTNIVEFASHRPATKTMHNIEPGLTVSEVEGGTALAIAGPLNIHKIVEAENLLGRKRAKKSRSVDLSSLGNLDTPGALFLCGLRDKGVKLTGIRAEHQALLDLICGLDLKPLPKVEPVPRWRQIVIQLGKGAHDARHDALDIITFVGRAASWTVTRCCTRAACARLRFRGMSRKPASTRCPSSA